MTRKRLAEISCLWCYLLLMQSMIISITFSLSAHLLHLPNIPWLPLLQSREDLVTDRWDGCIHQQQQSLGLILIWNNWFWWAPFNCLKKLLHQYPTQAHLTQIGPACTTAPRLFGCPAAGGPIPVAPCFGTGGTAAESLLGSAAGAATSPVVHPASSPSASPSEPLSSLEQGSLVPCHSTMPVLSCKGKGSQMGGGSPSMERVYPASRASSSASHPDAWISRAASGHPFHMPAILPSVPGFSESASPQMGWLSCSSGGSRDPCVLHLI